MQSAAATRLASLDLFRGATIAAMILVNNPGSDAAYAPLQHAVWNGCTPTDLIFPSFLFIVGVSLVFSFQSRLARGATRSELVQHTLWRSAAIFGIGLMLNGLPHFTLATWRIPGVLQRIALAYLAAALITLYARTPARVAWVVGLLLGYWALMRFVPVPGHGIPGQDVPLLHPDWNIAAYLDRKLMLGHLYEGTRDPEGIISTLPSIATALIGVLAGEWLRSTHSPNRKAQGMVSLGALGLLTGLLWNVWLPINKKLWTSSYVLFAAGFALICLGICYWLTDIKLRRGWWIKPFLVFGTNAIAAYVIADLLGTAGYAIHLYLGRRVVGAQEYLFQRFFSHISPPGFASLLFSVAFVGLCFLPIWWMYRKRIFLKI
jgi:predicted acyltransferase